jgi:hypothetical protein
MELSHFGKPSKATIMKIYEKQWNLTNENKFEIEFEWMDVELNNLSTF